MQKRFIWISFFVISLLVLAALCLADPQNPQASTIVGKISVGAKPPGQIAFISDGDIWVMDSDGKNRFMVCESKNARGRLSFSPNNKRIAFSREGMDRNNLPSGEGGAHRLYDIFIAYLDSAQTKVTWWTRLTNSLGAQHAEWSLDGNTIYCQNDIYAGEVDYIAPSQQIMAVEAEGGNYSYLRKDWSRLHTNMKLPTLSPDGRKMAFVTNYSQDPEKLSFQNLGVKVIDMVDLMMSESELRKASPGLEQCYAPSFSPDSKWLAVVSNDMNNPGIFLVDANNVKNKKQIFTPAVTQQISASPVGWSPDSKWICFATTDGIIYTLDINGESLTPLTGIGKHSYPTWSR